MTRSIETDLVVIGSGVAGLTAALSAALRGLDVIVLEHSDRIGGTSARSSGTVWIPDNRYMREAGMTGDREKAEAYLAALVGNRGPAKMWQTFLDAGPKMLDALSDGPGIAFRPFLTSPDYRQDQPGAAPGGRPLEPLPFDGRTLGPWFDRLDLPLPELVLFGGMMVTRAEAAQLVRADRSASALKLALSLTARYAKDRLSHKRGTRLVLGNALVARLLKACLDRGVTVHCGADCRALIKDGRRVSGVEAVIDGAGTQIAARSGVVMAGGGFPANPAMRAEHLPQPVVEYSPAAPGCDGTTIGLALEAGASLGPAGEDNALWFPSSFARRADGTMAVYPHIALDRSKPGMIAVDGTGRRFTNEAVSYHEFVRAMYRADPVRKAIPAWLICDAERLRRYGMGLVRPRSRSVARHVESGYLLTGDSIAALAGRMGVPADALQATVERYNGFADTGKDADFNKGETLYDRANGDAGHGPNPCIGPIEKAPFYAVALYPTPLGTSRGLLADEAARVLDSSGRPIPGLYVCGNDMQSAFGGEYPGAGGQLGQGMTFGWLAANHAADQREGTA